MGEGCCVVEWRAKVEEENVAEWWARASVESGGR